VLPAEPISLARLPHGDEARLLTRATGDPGSGVVLGIREPAGFLPRCLLIELMAQTAGLALPEEGGGGVVALIPRMRLHRDAAELETVAVEARLDRRFGAFFRFDCRATSGGDILADGTIVLRMT
jgi:3-hydroxymyristoyl/3-hydroxydecanoyl-(acyl carrier protein) dehydratase